jgi:hypothetical protein
LQGAIAQGELSQFRDIPAEIPSGRKKHGYDTTSAAEDDKNVEARLNVSEQAFSTTWLHHIDERPWPWVDMFAEIVKDTAETHDLHLVELIDELLAVGVRRQACESGVSD